MNHRIKARPDCAQRTVGWENVRSARERDGLLHRTVSAGVGCHPAFPNDARRMNDHVDFDAARLLDLAAFGDSLREPFALYRTARVQDDSDLGVLALPPGHNDATRLAASRGSRVGFKVSRVTRGCNVASLPENLRPGHFRGGCLAETLHCVGPSPDAAAGSLDLGSHPLACGALLRLATRGPLTLARGPLACALYGAAALARLATGRAARV